MNQLVSIIMSCYNESQIEIKQSINSVLRQTYENFEFIIVLDNPQNRDLLCTLLDFKNNDDRIVLLINENNIGLPESLNKAIKIANGKYIARMDADDICMNTRLEKQIDFLESNLSCDIVGCNRIDIDSNGNELNTSYKVPKSAKSIYRILKYGSPIVHPSVIFRKEIIDKLQGYRNFKAAQDYDLWLRALTFGANICVLNDRLLYYRIRDNGITIKNPYKQYIYKKYAKKLYKERKKNGTDTYSIENMNRFFDKHNFQDKLYEEKFNAAYENFYKGISLVKECQYFSGLNLIAVTLLKNKDIKSIFISAILYKLCYLF